MSEPPVPISRPVGRVAAGARVGLVLAGGGAKGPYQLGVVDYLAEAGVRLAAVAGASIGALNAAVIAAAPDLATAAARLGAVWGEVGIAADAAPPGVAQLVTANPVARPEFIDRLLRRHVDPGELSRGLPLWVSVYPSPPNSAGRMDLSWLVDVVLDASARAEWLHVNALPRAEMHEALCASSALPLILPPRTVGGVRYRDGGIADNTPIRPLLTRSPCDVFIVVHLSQGSLWDAHDYASGRILEIRPERSLSDGGLLGGVAALLDFVSARALTLRRQGYRDAKRALSTVSDVLSSTRAMRRAQDSMLESLRLLDEQISGQQDDGT